MLQIDLTNIIRSRVTGWKGKLIPGFALRRLERLIRQDRLNELLRITDPATGSDFSAALYKELGVSLEVHGLENIPAEGRFIFASNHPLGGLDGVGIVMVLGHKYGDNNIRFLVNDLLMHVEPLRTVFLPINKYGAQGRAAAAEITRTYESEKQIIIFPAGLVSRLGADGRVRDLEWHKSFVQKAVQYKRDIILMRFEGLNRPRFYRFARWRKLSGLKINLEQAMLPAEFCEPYCRKFDITFLPPVSYKELEQRIKAGETPTSIAASLREQLYDNTPKL